MSDQSSDPASLIQELAKEIFTGMAASAGPGYWDWNPLAQTAFNAAQAFYSMAASATQPQSSVQTTDGAPAAADSTLAAADSAPAAADGTLAAAPAAADSTPAAPAADPAAAPAAAAADSGPTPRYSYPTSAPAPTS
jgi:hypothetical protein